MDALENAMHNLDVKKLMLQEEADMDLTARVLRELLVLRIMHNALEAAGVCDLMDRHVVLQSLRSSQSKINLFVCKVVELPGGYTVTPHRSGYPIHPVSLESALLLWYNAHFEGKDPLQMKH